MSPADGSVTNAFTVDLEDWYQGLEMEPSTWGGFEDRVEVGTRALLDLLDEAGARATFFVLGWTAARHPDLVAQVRQRGHEVGTHGYGHRFVYRIGEDGFRDELDRSLAALDRAGAGRVLGHRAPFFSVTRQSLWAFRVLAERGLAYDSSVFPVLNYRYGIPDAPRFVHRLENGLLEFPISTLRCCGCNLPVGGGAYFRLFPYTLTRFALRRINAGGQPAVFYIHPWELDPDHPRLDLPRRIRLTHYWNLSGTRQRLRRLLRDFRFASMAEVLDLRNGPTDT